MQFLITAYDGKDENAQARRSAARPAHIEGAKDLLAGGQVLIGGAILNDADEMIGSSLVVEFENREALDQWLNNDPYVTENVWQDITVQPFRTAVKS
jgi:uncharacterized protein YciI